MIQPTNAKHCRGTAQASSPGDWGDSGGHPGFIGDRHCNLKYGGGGVGDTKSKGGGLGTSSQAMKGLPVKVVQATV